jgi:hypothetical protein
MQNNCLGFLIDDIAICCACAENLANSSNYPHFFYLLHKRIPMDQGSRCACGKFPFSQANLDAAERISSMMIKGELADE